MKMTPEEIAKAKRQLELSRMTPEDRALSLKYPKHTLAAARMIDSTPIQCPSCGMPDVFAKLRMQETHGFHIDGDRV